MQTLGEKLAEARMNKGLSIQEASEQTKIRVCFLEAFEQNNFDLDLPDIYKQGFVKNYADLLGLDPNGIASESSSGSGGTARSGRRRESRENFGKVDLGRTKAGASTDQPAVMIVCDIDSFRQIGLNQVAIGRISSRGLLLSRNLKHLPRNIDAIDLRNATISQVNPDNTCAATNIQNGTDYFILT